MNLTIHCCETHVQSTPPHPLKGDQKIWNAEDFALASRPMKLHKVSLWLTSAYLASTDSHSFDDEQKMEYFGMPSKSSSTNSGGCFQNVLSSKQWQPQPVGHTSWVRNHSIMWLVWPPCPQVRQKFADPRTATWQMAHWKVKPLQISHCVPRPSLRQWQQYTPNSEGESREKLNNITSF